MERERERERQSKAVWRHCRSLSLVGRVAALSSGRRCMTLGSSAALDRSLSLPRKVATSSETLAVRQRQRQRRPSRIWCWPRAEGACDNNWRRGRASWQSNRRRPSLQCNKWRQCNSRQANERPQRVALEHSAPPAPPLSARFAQATAAAAAAASRRPLGVIGGRSRRRKRQRRRRRQLPLLEAAPADESKANGRPRAECANWSARPAHNARRSARAQPRGEELRANGC